MREVTTNHKSGRRPGRPPKAEAGDTKGALVEAAMTLFARHGYAGTSIRAIAREVGLSESVLYAHFEGKRAIYDAAMALAGPGVAIAAVEATPGAEPGEFIRAFADHVLTAWDTPQGRRVIDLVSRDGLIHDDMLIGGIERALQGLAGVFAGWIGERRIRDDLGSPEDLAYALLAPVAHARLLWLHGDATVERRRAARERVTRHADLFARSVAPCP